MEPEVWRIKEPLVEVMQVTETNASEVAAWCGGWDTSDLRWSEHMGCYRRPDDDPEFPGALFLTFGPDPTPGAVMMVHSLVLPGQWVIRQRGFFGKISDAELRRKYKPEEG